MAAIETSLIFYKCHNIKNKCMIRRGINRAEIAAQCTRHCTTLALRSHPTSLFPPSYNHLLCNSAIDVIFPILFCCNHVYCILVCPHNLVFKPTFFSLCLCAEPSNMLSMSSPLAILHICTWYLIALA